MAVSESQLDTWAKIGAQANSKATYGTLKSVLEAKDAVYADKQFEIFLQGSYGNDTNIYADSDVDIVIATSNVYYFDTSYIDEQQSALLVGTITPPSYDYVDFQRDVKVHLQKRFGNDVDCGNKAIYVKGNGHRRDSDIVSAVEYRRYLSFKSPADQSYVKGICFWDSNGVQIINYPRQHTENCTIKHQVTNSWFKPCVRILKNMRNAMIERALIIEGLAPSYFLEGMLYNVPNSLFGGSYISTISNALNWIKYADRSKLQCANELYWLCNPKSPVTWRADKLDEYLTATISYWNSWK